MSSQPKGRCPSSNERDHLRTILCMGANEPFIRCKARDMRKVKAFEEQGDFSHSERLHVCEDCRCENIAGKNTNDDFYDIEGIGHYGVGFCWDHEKGRNRHQAISFARRQMKALQTHGVRMAENQDYEAITSEELAIARCAGMPLEQATRKEQVSNARHTVDVLLKRMVMILEGDGSLYPERVIEELVEIKEILGDCLAAGLTLPERDLIDKINSVFTHDIFVTEKCGTSVIPMTYGTKIDKLKNLAVAVSKIGLDDFRMTEHDYVEKRIVAMKLKQTMADIGKELAPEFGDEVTDRVKQNLIDRVFLPIWADV